MITDEVVLSDEQSNAVREIEAEVQTRTVDGHTRLLLVQAVAGSGKSTTLVALTNRLTGAAKCRRVLLLVFNVSLVASLRDRLGDETNAQVSTLHAQGLQLLRQQAARDLSGCLSLV